MIDVFRKTGFVTDGRVHLADDAPLGDRAVFVSRARFVADRAALLARGHDLGLELEPNDGLDDLDDALAVCGAVAIRFPKFNDGRGYSLARLLRDRHGYRGELRAVGDVLVDQVEALFRVGFDTLEIDDAPTRARLAARGTPELAVRYQPTGEGFAPIQHRPWASHTYQRAWRDE